MTTSHGKNTTVLASTFDLSSRVNQVQFTRTQATATVTGMGVDDDELIAGVLGGSLSLQGAWDDATSGPETVLEPLIGTNVYWTVVWDGGDASGDLGNRCGLMTTVQQYDPRAAANDAVRYSAAGSAAEGARLAGRLLHPLTSESATGDYASVDNSASTAFGAVGQIHVTSFTGTSATVKIQDSPNDSVWADLITFSSVTGVTSERLTASGTVDRYLRAQISAGTFSEITFAVSAARNAQ